MNHQDKNIFYKTVLTDILFNRRCVCRYEWSSLSLGQHIAKQHPSKKTPHSGRAEEQKRLHSIRRPLVCAPQRRQLNQNILKLRTCLPLEKVYRTDCRGTLWDFLETDLLRDLLRRPDLGFKTKKRNSKSVNKKRNDEKNDKQSSPYYLKVLFCLKCLHVRPARRESLNLAAFVFLFFAQSFAHNHLLLLFSACVTNSEEIPNSSRSNPKLSPSPIFSLALSLFFGRMILVSHDHFASLRGPQTILRGEKSRGSQSKEKQETAIENERGGLASA